ncbi:MAG TPA: hypothetical protein VM364_08080 [Vicinamibacterales bacterium]|nr:hypothetical protein [Vicinamibacterales bacterium]
MWRTLVSVALMVLGLALPTAAQDEQLVSKLYLTSWSGATITSASGAPSASEPNGSLYLRTDTGQWYQRIGGAWVTLTDASGKIPALSSTYFASLSGANLTSLPAGQLTGTIASGVRFADGSAAGPSISFANAPTVGFYLSSNVIHVAHAGTRIARFAGSTNAASWLMGPADATYVRLGNDVGLANGNSSRNVFLNPSGGGGVHVVGSNPFGWAPSETSSLAGMTLQLWSPASDVLEQRRGANPQTWRLAKTHTNASNYERLTVFSDAGGYYIGTEWAGTGEDRALRIGTRNGSGGWLFAATTNDLSGSGNISTSGTVTLGGVASHLIPTTTDTYDLGRHDRYWDEAFISTLNSVVYRESTQLLFGGYSTVGRQAGSFAADVSSAATTINFAQTMTPGHWVQVRAHDTAGAVKVEYLTVGSLVSGTTYNVTRDLAGAHGTDPAWAAGTPFLVLGTEGDGRIDLLAYDGKPRIAFVQQGATFNAQHDRCVIGNLNGYYSYASDIYGLACGDAAAANVTTDPTNGFRVRHGTTERIKLAADGSGFLANSNIAWNAAGALTITGDATIGGWSIGASSITGGNATLASSGNLTLGTSDDVLRASADDATYRLWIGAATAAIAPFRVTKAGGVTMAGATITGSDITLGTAASYLSSNALKFARPSNYTGVFDLYSVAGSGLADLYLENDLAPAFGTSQGRIILRARSYSVGPTPSNWASLTLTSLSSNTVSAAQLVADQIALTGATSISGAFSTSGAITERNRATPLGEWQSVAYSSGHFSASSGSWTVESADQEVLGYTLVGKTLTVTYRLTSTSVSATPGALRVAIPGGFTAARSTLVPIGYAADAGTIVDAYASVGSGGTNIVFNKRNAANWSTATNSTDVIGQITFEIQ